MEAGWQAYADGIEKVRKYNARILRAIKTVKGKAFVKHLSALMESCEAVDWANWEILKEPIGSEQSIDEYGREIRKEWVDQRATGTEGDSWEGTICVQIKPNKYLKFHFSM